MNQAYQPYIDDEIDLREIVLTLLRGWKIILLLTVLVGAAAFGYSKLQTPVYEAKALISIDQEALGLSINPINFLLSDAVRQNVADELGVSVASLPSLPNAAREKEQVSISVAPYDTGKTMFLISVQGESPQGAKDIVNAWADAGVAAAVNFLLPYEAEYLAAEETAIQANRTFIQYLDKNDLLRWSWTDLSLLTGFGWQPTVLLTDSVMNDAPLGESEKVAANLSIGFPDSQDLPSISAEQRLEIIQLMRAQTAAEAEYNLARGRNAETVFAVKANPPQVSNYAITPENPVSPKTLMNTALGLVLGGMLGVFWVFVAGWWQGSEQKDDE